MKTGSFKALIMSFVLATLSLFVVAQEQPTHADKLAQGEAEARVQSITTKKQAKAFVASAKTSEEHMKQVAYFNQESDRLVADAKGHAGVADLYRQDPHPTGGGKQSGSGSIYRTAERCDSAAKSLGDAAKNMRELAAEHEQMAKDVAK